jgi:rhodanese-related sulfurtransferase
MAGQAFRESLCLVITATVLGLLYTGVTGKGMFASGEASKPSPAAASEYAPEYIDFADAYGLFASGEALFVDTRYEYDYELGHIRGAINIPLKEYDEKKSLLSSVAKDRLIVTYCDGQECNSSLDVATKLSSEGYSDVHFFFGGWTEWQANSGPTEAGK